MSAYLLLMHMNKKKIRLQSEASGRTEIMVRRYPPTVWVLVGAAILLIVVLMMR